MIGSTSSATYCTLPSYNYNRIKVSGHCGAYAYITIRPDSLTGTILWSLLNPGEWNHVYSLNIDISSYHNKTIYIINAPKNGGSNFDGTTEMIY